MCNDIGPDGGEKIAFALQVNINIFNELDLYSNK